MNHREPLFKKADIVLAILLFALGVGSLFALKSAQKDGKTAVIRVDGEEIAAYPLSQDRTETLDTGRGYNTIQIRDGQVWVASADCPGGNCVEKGRISKSGEVILCLPHKLSITISSEEGGPDAVSF